MSRPSALGSKAGEGTMTLIPQVDRMEQYRIGFYVSVFPGKFSTQYWSYRS